MKKGLFVNTRKANCSIYSSGLMIYNALKDSVDYELTYKEISHIDVNSLHSGNYKPYDFYIFNYHHNTMRLHEGVDSRYFVNLPGKKICIILEMTADDPFIFMRPEGFDEFLVLDPTFESKQNNIHAFSRPLSNFRSIKHYDSIPEVPVIGSFGYATFDKGFHLIAAAVSHEFDKAILRINLPPSTFADVAVNRHFGADYKTMIEDQCRANLKVGIELQFTRDYFSDDQLIDWCAENTLNCFFYTRDLPGLAATTDQVVMSGAPLLVSSNTTFRHIHKYVQPYPAQSLKDAILNGAQNIEQMQKDWSPEACKEVLKSII